MPEHEQASRGGLFARLRAGLRRSQESLALRLKEVFAGRTKIDAELFEELEAALLQADLGPVTTRKLLDDVSRRVREERVEDAGRVKEMLAEGVQRLLQGAKQQAAGSSMPPLFVSLVIGVNGVGKTTTLGKLARYHASEGRSVVIAAADTFRAAAIEQLAVWAERASARLVRHQEGADPAAVVYDALETSLARKDHVLLVDTAGRLHTKDNLMVELEKIRRTIAKRVPGAPHETLLVLDATTGQNALVQAREFGSRIGVTGLVVTKLDGTAKGGVVVSIASELGLPVAFIGVGEGIDDLVRFDPLAFSGALFA